MFRRSLAIRLCHRLEFFVAGKENLAQGNTCVLVCVFVSTTTGLIFMNLKISSLI